MTKEERKETFEIATNAFKVMTNQEQGLVLIFFKHSKDKNIIESWADSVHTVVKNSSVKHG